MLSRIPQIQHDVLRFDETRSIKLYQAILVDDNMESTTLEPNYPWAHVAGQQKCWTCRKKRVKCDGCLPTCFKCKKTGRQCLGYSKNKPLVWTGVASRGRMANRTFENPEALTSTNLRPAPPKRLLVKSLTEPTFKDLNDKASQYLSYYIHRCCIECTLYGDDSQNRFKHFMVLLPDNPVLVHIMIALSATHQASAAICPPRTPEASGASSALAVLRRKGLPRSDSNSLTHRNDLFSTQRLDALSHLSLGMGALREAVANAKYSDALIATIFLLTWIDVMESKGSTWRLHLEGLKTLISLRRNPSSEAISDSQSNINSPFQIWFEDFYTVLAIFGSTFDPGNLNLLDAVSRSELRGILDRAESYMWNGCPSELVYILHTFNTIACGTLHLPPEDIPELFDRLREFDCEAWMSRSGRVSARPARRSLAEAWKCTIEIYGLRALRGRDPSFDDVPRELVDNAFFHLSQIPHDDTHFKGTVWPAFVAGGDARTEEHRQLVVGIFGHLIEFLHLSVLQMAYERLEKIWTRSSPYPPGRSWVHDIWDIKGGILLL
ncbi:fungal-specific transcription factor domain-containing protein [Camillea tinctor]|nr:fungal-specific transcription factor domain-containing protein [Camillea tinctor]